MVKRQIQFVPAVLAGFCTTALLILPFKAQAERPMPATFEIVRPGDRAMACPALAAEINQLGQARTVADAKPKKRGGLGFLRALGSAVPLVGMGNSLVAGMAGTAQQIAMTSQSDRQTVDAQQMARDAMAGGSPEEQRKTRLMAIFEAKNC